MPMKGERGLVLTLRESASKNQEHRNFRDLGTNTGSDEEYKLVCISTAYLYASTFLDRSRRACVWLVPRSARRNLLPC